jgi:hypothetical protein
MTGEVVQEQTCDLRHFTVKWDPQPLIAPLASRLKSVEIRSPPDVHGAAVQFSSVQGPIARILGTS